MYICLSVFLSICLSLTSVSMFITFLCFVNIAGYLFMFLRQHTSGTSLDERMALLVPIIVVVKGRLHDGA